ncbi:MAG: LPS assembly protein LptD [Gammaproteobacteria bacterium]|nr:LPS assembly protein LptD [Gammaproteobacteria bacterium]
MSSRFVLHLSAFSTAFVFHCTPSSAETLAEELWKEDSTQQGCGGSYVLVLEDKEETQDESVATTTLLADRVSLDLDGTGRVVGNVLIQRDGNTLEAPAVDLDTEEGVFQTPQGAKIVSQDIAVRVGVSDVGVNSESVKIVDAEFVMLNEGYRGRANSLSSTAQTVELQDTFVTQCPPNINSWYLTANQLRFDREENLAIARGVRLNLGRIPIFYVPYARFPTVQQRTSGLLLPQFESSSLLGFEVGLPVYFNLAPNYDFTLTPKLSSKRNHSMEFEFRHRNSGSNSKLVAIVLQSDRRYQDYVNRLLRIPSTSISAPSERWLLNVKQDLWWSEWETDVDYSLVSDTDFYRDFGESVEDFNHVGLARVLRISRIGSNIGLGISAERYDPFRSWGTHVSKLPQITLNGNNSFGPLKVSLKFDWARMESQGIELLQEFDRRHGEILISLPLSKTWGYSTWKVLRTFTQFHTSERILDDRATTTYLLDSGLWLQRLHNQSNTISHTLEPRLVIASRANVPQIGYPDWDIGPPSASIRTLVEPFRRAGIDRIGELEAMSLSVVARFMDQASSRQKARVTAVVSMPSEGLGIEFDSKFIDELSAGGFHLIRPDRWTDEASGATIRYERDRVDLVAQIRQHQPDDLLQTFVSAKLSLNETWTLYGRWNYDWTFDRHVESFAGFEYSGCCVAFRFLWRKSLRYGFADWEDLRSRTGLHFELSLKGLTSFGDNIASMLERGAR